jgi:hypothetical protein
MKRLSETWLTIHMGFENPPMLFQQASVSWNIDFGTGLSEKSAQLVSIFIEAV